MVNDEIRCTATKREGHRCCYVVAPWFSGVGLCRLHGRGKVADTVTVGRMIEADRPSHPRMIQRDNGPTVGQLAP